MLYITNQKDMPLCVFLDGDQHERKFDLIGTAFHWLSVEKSFKDLSSLLRLIKLLLNFHELSLIT